MHNKLTPHPDLPIDLPTAERLAKAVEHYGESTVVDHSVALMRGKNAGKDFLLYVGGRHALGKVANDDQVDWTPALRLFSGDVAYV